MRLDQIPLAAPVQPVLQEPRYLRPGRDDIYARNLARNCPACDAGPGTECDGSKISVFEGMHFARHETFQWPPKAVSGNG